jgi:hypothetical protein
MKVNRWDYFKDETNVWDEGGEQKGSVRWEEMEAENYHAGIMLSC